VGASEKAVDSHGLATAATLMLQHDAALGSQSELPIAEVFANAASFTEQAHVQSIHESASIVLKLVTT
jgi:hypothetical protein